MSATPSKHGTLRRAGGRLALCFVLSVVALLRPLSGVSADVLGETERLSLADGLYSRGMHELAVAEYKALLRDFPASRKSDVIHFRMGECALGLKNPADAESEFRLVYEKHPRSGLRMKAGLRIGEILMDSSKFDDALAILMEVANGKPGEEVGAASLFDAGEALLKLKKPGESAGVLERLLKEYPASRFASYALLKLGAISEVGPQGEPERERAERLGKALKFYEEAEQKADSDRVRAESLFQAGNVLFRMGRFEESARTYGKLIERHPGDQRAGEARLPAAWSCHNAGLYADALGYAAARLKQAASPPGSPAEDVPEWLYLKANCERQLLKYGPAVASYSKLLAGFPKSRFCNAARYEKALVLNKTGKFEDAIAEALLVRTGGPAAESQPPDRGDVKPGLKRDVFWLLAESYAALKKHDEAIQYYRLILKEFPADPIAGDAAYRLAYHLESKQEYKEAARFYAGIADSFPAGKQAPAGLFASALCFVKVKMDAEAARDWARLIDAYPSDPLVEEALYQKAMSEIRLRRDKEALSTLDGLLKRNKETRFRADIRHWRGVLLAAAGKLADAEEELRLSLKSDPSKELARETTYQLALVLQKAGKPDEAAGLLYGLIAGPALDRFQPEQLQWLGEYMHAKGKYAESVAAVQALAAGTNAPEWRQAGWCIIGRGQLMMGETNKAAQAFKTSLETGAATGYAARSALQLGNIELEAGNREAAAGYFERAAKLAGDDALIEIRARAYAGLGRNAKAGAEYENAARFFMSVAILFDDPNVAPECLSEAAESFRKLGRDQESRKAIAELKQRYPESKWAQDAQ